MTSHISESNDVILTMTLTTPHCPAAETLPGRRGTKGIRPSTVWPRLKVDITWEPAWSPQLMSEAARLELNFKEEEEQCCIRRKSPNPVVRTSFRPALVELKHTAGRRRGPQERARAPRWSSSTACAGARLAWRGQESRSRFSTRSVPTSSRPCSRAWTARRPNRRASTSGLPTFVAVDRALQGRYPGVRARALADRGTQPAGDRISAGRGI